MSPRLPVLTSRDVIKVAKKLGFQFDRQSGSHAVYIHPGKDIKPKTLKGIIDDMGVTIDELLK